MTLFRKELTKLLIVVAHYPVINTKISKYAGCNNESVHTLCILFSFAVGIWCSLDSSFHLHQSCALSVYHQSPVTANDVDRRLQCAIARSSGALLSDTMHTLLDPHVLDRGIQNSSCRWQWVMGWKWLTFNGSNPTECTSKKSRWGIF